MPSAEPLNFYQPGQGITANELVQAYQRITGLAYPRGLGPSQARAQLQKQHPVRFAFEIDRARGLAFDNGES